MIELHIVHGKMHHSRTNYNIVIVDVECRYTYILNQMVFFLSPPHIPDLDISHRQQTIGRSAARAPDSRRWAKDASCVKVVLSRSLTRSMLFVIMGCVFSQLFWLCSVDVACAPPTMPREIIVYRLPS